MDEPRVARAQLLIGEAHGREARGAKILDEHVGLGGKLRHDSSPACALEIDRDAFLVAVYAEIIGGDPLDRGRHPGPSIVTAVGVLDLPDLGAEIRERHGAPWAGEDPRQVKHLDAVERRCHCCLSPACSKPCVPSLVSQALCPKPCVQYPPRPDKAKGNSATSANALY